MLLVCVAAGGTINIVEGRMHSTKYQEISEADIQRPVQILKLER